MCLSRFVKKINRMNLGINLWILKVLSFEGRSILSKINRILNFLIFMIFISYWPVEKGKINLRRYFYCEENARYFDYLTIIYFVIVGITILFFVYIIKVLSLKNKKIYVFFVDIVFIVLFMYRFISLILLNKGPIIGFISRQVCILIIYLIIRYNERNENIFNILLAVGLTNSVLVILQFFLYKNKFQLNFLQIVRYARFPGGFIDPVVLSIFFVYCIIILLNKRNEFNICLYNIFFVLLLIGILFTGSRGAFIIFFITLFIHIINHMNDVVKENKINVKAIISVLVIILLCLINSDIIDKAVSSYDNYVINAESSRTSTESRIPKVKAAIELFKEKKLIGVGTNNYDYYVRHEYGRRMPNPHNIYAQVLSENGIIGFLLSMIFIFMVLESVIRNRDCFTFELIVVWLIGGIYIGLLSDFTGTILFIITFSNYYNSLLIHNKAY